MKLFTKSVAAAFIGVALGVSSSQVARAAGTALSSTQTQTATSTLSGDTETLNFSKFDSSLGTLTSIQYIISWNASTLISLTNIGTSSVTYTVGNTVTLSLSDSTGNITLNYLSSTQSQKYTLASGSTQQITDNSAGTSNVTYDSTGALSSYTVTGGAAGSVTSPISLSDYQGSGSYTLTLNGVEVTSVVGSNKTETDSGSADVTVEVVYSYTPTAVPEPTTWAMLFGGVGTLVLVQQLRRRHHA